MTLKPTSLARLPARRADSLVGYRRASTAQGAAPSFGVHTSADTEIDPETGRA